MSAVVDFEALELIMENVFDDLRKISMFFVDDVRDLTTTLGMGMHPSCLD